MEDEHHPAPLVVGRQVSPEVVDGHTMSQEQFSKYRLGSCHAIGHPVCSAC
jgi:hypothetical protein